MLEERKGKEMEKEQEKSMCSSEVTRCLLFLLARGVFVRGRMGWLTTGSMCCAFLCGCVPICLSPPTPNPYLTSPHPLQQLTHMTAGRLHLFKGPISTAANTRRFRHLAAHALGRRVAHEAVLKVRCVVGWSGLGCVCDGVVCVCG
jgi:hypothetical protein